MSREFLNVTDEPNCCHSFQHVNDVSDCPFPSLFHAFSEFSNAHHFHSMIVTHKGNFCAAANPTHDNGHVQEISIPRYYVQLNLIGILRRE
jgi:hypothetical protein